MAVSVSEKAKLPELAEEALTQVEQMDQPFSQMHYEGGGRFMALIKCPECGREISDKTSVCTHCGYRLRKKTRFLVMGIIAVCVCLSAADAAVYHMLSNVTITAAENAALNAMEYVSDALVNPGSLVVYDCKVSYYDAKMDSLAYRTDELSPMAENDGIDVYLHIGTVNKAGGISEEEYAVVLSEDGKLVKLTNSVDGLQFQTDKLKWTVLDRKEIQETVRLVNKKKTINVTDPFTKASEENVDSVIDDYIHSYLVKEDFDAAYEYAGRAFSPEEKYEDIRSYINGSGQKCLDDGMYEKAMEYFELADNPEKITECKAGIFEEGKSFLEAEEYDKAKEIFTDLGDYSDSQLMVKECDYQLAVRKMQAGQYDDAYSDFNSMIEYKDSENMMLETRYQEARSILEENRYDSARELFGKLGDYSDSPAMIMECDYRYALDLIKERKYTKAYEILTQISDYKDSQSVIESSKKTRYNAALKLLEDGKYEKAITVFT